MLLPVLGCLRILGTGYRIRSWKAPKALRRGKKHSRLLLFGIPNSLDLSQVGRRNIDLQDVEASLSCRRKAERTQHRTHQKRFRREAVVPLAISSPLLADVTASFPCSQDWRIEVTHCVGGVNPRRHVNKMRFEHSAPTRTALHIVVSNMD